MSHSLGAQVVLSTLESLHDDKKWNSCGYGKDKITSIHVLGAAVPNTTVSKQTNSYGNAIESEVGIFHNKFNNEDTVLSVGYTIGGSGQALGEEGASSVSNKPSNYKQSLIESLPIIFDGASSLFGELLSFLISNPKRFW